MKPNHKASAEKYRKLYSESQDRLSFMHTAIRDMTADLTRQQEEINEWKRKYSKLLDEVIAIQEKVAEAGIDKFISTANVAPIADTVLKMQQRLKEHLEKPEFPWDSFTVAEEVIDQIAKEMLEGENDQD